MNARAGERGIALFEVLLSVVILSVGIIVVFQPLMTSLDAIRESENRLLANRLMTNQLWLTGEAVSRTGNIPSAENAVLSHGDKAFYFGMKSIPLGLKGKLFQVDAVLGWQQGSRRRSIQRTVYTHAW